MSPYQNQTVVVNNNDNNNNMEDRTVKTQKKKKNILYTGTILFLTIVAVVIVRMGVRKVNPVICGPSCALFGSVTNANVRTSTAIMSSEDDDDTTWYDATEEKEEAGQHDDSDSDTGGNTSDRFDPQEYPPVQFTPQEAGGGYGNTVTVTKKNTKKKCPACYFPTSTLVGNVCQQLCHDTQQEQHHAVRKGRGWNFVGNNKVQDNWCAGTYLSTNEVQVGKGQFSLACIFKTGDNGGSIFDKSY